MFEERFFRKAHFQLRDFGAADPLVSFSQNVSSSVSRQPVIVTGDELWTFACAAASTVSGFAVNSGAGVLTGDSTTGAVFAGDSEARAFTDSTVAADPIVASALCASAVTDVAAPFATLAFAVSRRTVASALSGVVLASGGAVASAREVAFGCASVAAMSA